MRAESRPEGGLPPDVVFDVLTNPRRRYVLAFLRDESPLRIGELAELVAAAERETDVDRLTSKERKSVYTSLYQAHLPKLAGQGIVEYDRDRGVVALAERATELDVYLYTDPGDDAERRWSRRYLVLSAASGTALLANELLLGEPGSALVVTAGIILAFAGLTGAYVRDHRS